jgi:hypothetical protein
MAAIWCEIKIKLILYREKMVLGGFGYPVTLPRRPNDRRAVQNGRTRSGRRSRHLGDLLPEAGLSSVAGAKAAGEGLVGFERAIVPDHRGKGLAFEKVPGGMLVAGRFRTVERVVDHGPPQQGRGQRVPALDLACHRSTEPHRQHESARRGVAAQIGFSKP